MALSPRQREALRRIADGAFYPVLVREDDGWYARWRGSDDGENDWIDRYVREAVVTPLTEDAEDQRHETLHDAWLMALKSRTGRVCWDEAACRAFADELARWAGHAQEDVAARRSLVFSLDGSSAGFALRCPVPKGRRSFAALGQAAWVCGALRGLRRDETCPDRLTVGLSIAEAEAFVREGAGALAKAGYAVTGVDLAAAVTATAEVATANDGAEDVRKARLRLTVRVAGEPVTAEEIRFLLDQGTALVFFRSRWIEVDRAVLKAALRALERGSVQPDNLVSFALGIGHVGALEVEALAAQGWVRGLVERLRAAQTDVLPDAALPSAFVGTLRDYQRRGVAWLRFMTENGFGALLADDMGLGKTIQTIAWLTLQPKGCKTLVVAPVTLLYNWRHELASFAPSFAVYVHQGEGRHVASGFRAAVAASDVVLTSYNLLVRDHAALSEIAWDALVLDEAQYVKNHETQAARAACALRPARRIALTGTPVENSLMDVWSLEEFLNPGFLGERKSFQERFVRPLALDPQAAVGRRIRSALEPFILRRLKTDGAIAAELGQKREVRDYCGLAAADRRAYEAALADFAATEHAPGDAFALLTELKLICDGAAKRERLVDLLETIFANGESALVFTQYAKVGSELQRELAEHFGRPMPFLHGALSPEARQAAIRDFNRPGPRAFVLSLRAGGFGLNLTKATHVIHFDRWWNPAVENQATDRAHRIGQKRDVLVHLLLTVGTVEERVDRILAEKRTLKDLIADGEAFWKAVRL